MKKIIIYLSLLLVSNIVFSQKVDVNTAKRIAQKIYEKDKQSSNQIKVEELISIGIKDDTLLYIFPYPDDGFVIISADKAAPPVLGHCNKGKYEPENMPPGLLYLIDKYKYSITRLREKNIDATDKIKSQWSDLLDASSMQLKSYTVGTHILDTEWGQQSGFNQYCPEGYPAGCTAVAMAQILRRWNCWLDPTGIVSYSGIGWEGGYANFGATTYNWLDMNNTSSDDDNALLIYHAGVSVSPQKLEVIYKKCL